MSRLEGLEYVSFIVETSEACPWAPHEAHHRSFGPGDSTTHHLPDGGEVVERVELVAEQGDTLTFVLIGGEGPRTVALTVLSPTAGELTITSGAEWARCVVALLGLPDSHHDH